MTEMKVDLGSLAGTVVAARKLCGNRGLSIDNIVNIGELREKLLQITGSKDRLLELFDMLHSLENNSRVLAFAEVRMSVYEQDVASTMLANERKLDGWK